LSLARAVIVTTGWSVCAPVSCCSMAIQCVPFWWFGLTT
jgi:hypothetical protein